MTSRWIMIYKWVKHCTTAPYHWPQIVFVKHNIRILLPACSATVRLVHSWAEPVNHKIQHKFVVGRETNVRVYSVREFFFANGANSKNTLMVAIDDISLSIKAAPPPEQAPVQNIPIQPSTKTSTEPRENPSNII